MVTLQHHNPPELHSHPAFTQAVEVQTGASILFVGGQNGTDLHGSVVGDDLGVQTAKALDNVRLAV